MKVKLNFQVRYKGESHKIGSIVDVEEEVGKRWVNNNIATEVILKQKEDIKEEQEEVKEEVKEDAKELEIERDFSEMSAKELYQYATNELGLKLKSQQKREFYLDKIEEALKE